MKGATASSKGSNLYSQEFTLSTLTVSAFAIIRVDSIIRNYTLEKSFQL
ncbi:MAG: hypothetical protein ABIL03_02525 [candidate division WOR-3 bacterium]